MGLVRRESKHAEQASAPAPPPVEVQLTRLTDPDPDVRRLAALSLEGVSEAVPALLDRVAVETRQAVRDAILTTLAAQDTDEVARGLAVHLASDDAGLRTAVAEALARLPGSVPSLIPGLLADPDHDVRVMTAMVLADLPHPAALDWLSTMIRQDPHPNVVSAAVDALLPMAGPEHVAMLTETLDRFPDDPFLRFIVHGAVARLGEQTR